MQQAALRWDRMRYENISEGRFISRPNRFIAEVEIQDGTGSRMERVHVKNTGRCRELLIRGRRYIWKKALCRGERRLTIW